MGDYKDIRKKRDGTREGEEIETETKEFIVTVRQESRGVPYILITQNMWSEIDGEKGIYRIELYNHEEHEYYIYYPGKGKTKISTKELVPGERYKAQFSKVKLSDIIDEINRRLMGKYPNIKIQKCNEELLLVIKNKIKIPIVEYLLEKPSGGRASMLLKIHGATRETIILQFLLKDYGLEIKNITAIQKRGKVARGVKRIYLVGELLAIEYWKSPKLMTSYVITNKGLDPDRYLRNRNILRTLRLVKADDNMEVYEAIIDESVVEYIKAIYTLAFQIGQRRFTLVKEKIGLNIAEVFLTKLNYKYIERHPLEHGGPDIQSSFLTDGKISTVVFEVKITSINNLDRKFRDALNEIRWHVSQKYVDEIRDLDADKYGVIVIGLGNISERPLKALIYYNIWRMGDEER